MYNRKNRQCGPGAHFLFSLTLVDFNLHCYTQLGRQKSEKGNRAPLFRTLSTREKIFQPIVLA